MNYSTQKTAVSKPPLGIYTEFAADFSGHDAKNVYIQVDSSTGEIKSVPTKQVDIRRERFRLQRFVPKILGTRHRTNACQMILGHESNHAEIKQHSSGKTSLAKLTLCANLWCCPVCAARINEHRASEMREAMKWAKENDLEISLLTLTTKHGVGDAAKDLVDVITGSWRSITGHRLYNGKGGKRSLPGIKTRYGVQGYIRALEVTHGASGWHPHLHILIFSKKALDTEFKSTVFTMWHRHIVSKDLPAPLEEFAIDIQNGEEAGQYLTKYGEDGELVETSNGKEVTWDAADEMAKANIKTGRKGNRKPFQLLQDASLGCEKSEKLFLEFAKAFKGKSSLQWSPKLKSQVGIDDISDTEAAERGEDAKMIYAIPSAIWRTFSRAVRKNKACRSDLLTISESGTVADIAKYLAPFSTFSVVTIENYIISTTLEAFANDKDKMQSKA